MELERRFTDIYEKYSDAIFRFVLLKMRDRQRALDVTQDAFMKTWLYLAQGKTIGNPRAFLYRTAYTTLLNDVRKKEVLSLDGLAQDGWEPADEVPTADVLLMQTEEEDAVMRSVATLPEAFRDVLLLRFVDELSVREIADILGEKENTVSVRIHRALAKLKEIYERKIS